MTTTQLTEQQLKTLRGLTAKHPFDMLIFGGYICTTCTPKDADDPDDNVNWPCPALIEAGLDRTTANLYVFGHQDAVEVLGRQINDLHAKLRQADVEKRQLQDQAAAALRERDLARAGDQQEYPTAHAYDAACAAVNKHRSRADTLRRAMQAIIDGIETRPEPTEMPACDYLDVIETQAQTAIAEDIKARNNNPDVDLIGLAADIDLLRGLLNMSLRSNVMCEHRLAHGPDALTEHLRKCSPATRSIVAHTGTIDEQIQSFIAQGWKWDGNVEYVCGKRLRVLIGPEPTAMVDDLPVFAHLPSPAPPASQPASEPLRHPFEDAVAEPADRRRLYTQGGIAALLDSVACPGCGSAAGKSCFNKATGDDKISACEARYEAAGLGLSPHPSTPQQEGH